MVALFEYWAGSNLRVGLVLTCLVSAAYWNVVSGPLFFDDLHFIAWNQHVTGLEVAQIYRSSVTEGAGFPSNTYRPNQQLIFALIYRLFGTAPEPYHLSSILLHICNAGLVFLLSIRLVISRPAALLASLVFALHPIQSQSVSYISGLAGPLALLFLLSGFERWIASLYTDDLQTRGLRFASALLLFAAAFFSKGEGVILAPLALLIAVYLVLIDRILISRFLIGSVACLVSMAFGYMYLKLTLLNFTGNIGMVEGSNFYTEHLYVRISTFISVLHHYAKMILWPQLLSYSKPDLRYITPFTIEGLIGLMIIAIGLMALLRMRQRPMVFLGAGWFFAALAPFSGIIPLTSMYLEHWLYAPMIGVAIGVAAIYEKATPRLRQGMVLLLIPIVLLAITRTVLRNRDWADAERFYLAEIEAVGVTVRMLNNLAIVYSDRGEIDKAIASYSRLSG